VAGAPPCRGWLLCGATPSESAGGGGAPTPVDCGAHQAARQEQAARGDSGRAPFGGRGKHVWGRSGVDWPSVVLGGPWEWHCLGPGPFAQSAESFGADCATSCPAAWWERPVAAANRRRPPQHSAQAVRRLRARGVGELRYAPWPRTALRLNPTCGVRLSSVHLCFRWATNRAGGLPGQLSRPFQEGSPAARQRLPAGAEPLALRVARGVTVQPHVQMLLRAGVP
jgi:hypothetical protein